MRKHSLQILLTALLLSASGCICTQFNSGSGDTSTPSTVEASCSRPYIQVGLECCLDANGNSICDRDETVQTTPHSLQTTTTQSPDTTAYGAHVTLPEELPTTTILVEVQTTETTAAASCSDGVQNQDETHADCGGACSSACQVFRLTGSWKSFAGYKFRLEKLEKGDKQTDYYLEFKTPEGLTAKPYVNTGESFIDYLRFRVINYPSDQPEIMVRLNLEDLALIPANASVMAVGGNSCPTYMTDNPVTQDLCCRNYQGYTVCLKSRSEQKILVVGPDGLKGKLELQDMKYRYFEQLVVSGFLDRKHFINGGYILLYLNTVG